jgi:hypothetical protein
LDHLSLPDRNRSKPLQPAGLEGQGQGLNAPRAVNRSASVDDQHINMKKFTSLLIGCSLALAGALMAQQPDEQQGGKKKEKEAAEQSHATEAKPHAGAGAKAERKEKTQQEPGGKNRGAGARNERAGAKGKRAQGRNLQRAQKAPELMAPLRPVQALA